MLDNEGFEGKCAGASSAAHHVLELCWIDRAEPFWGLRSFFEGSVDFSGPSVLRQR